MSLNGDIMVMRNGRSTSTVSIYNYPEHLNPFYEDDQHKRLRFWHINKKGDGDRRNSFSLGGIKDMWAFKSFRSKKKSSTLGINKTSESPPMLRREYQIDTGNLFNSYDRRARYSSNGTAPNGSSNNFDRNATYRSSLQNVHSSLDSPSGFGINRNDQYRSTIQFGGRNQDSRADSRPVPQPRRYVYGGSVTPQPLRNSEFNRGITKNSLTHGSSQLSVSTNPFDSDDDDKEDNEEQNANAGRATPLAGRRTPRKKRRAPAPPVPVHSTNSTDISSQTNNLHQTELRIEENLDIANLTAEIESFVKTTNEVPSEKETTKGASSEAQTKNESPKTNGTIPKEKILLKTSPNMVITKQFRPQSKSSNTDLCIKEDEVKPALPEKKKINQHPATVRKEFPSLEIGNVECIHVHVESPRTTPERTVASRVTSFKKEPTPPAERITSKTSFTLASPPTNRHEKNDSTALPQTVAATEAANATRKEVETVARKENGVTTEAATTTKPPISAKPTVEGVRPKRSQNFAFIHKPSKPVVLSSETEEIAEPAPSNNNKIQATHEGKPQTRDEFVEKSDSGLSKTRPNTSEKHVVFLMDESVKDNVSVTQNSKMAIKENLSVEEIAAEVGASTDAKAVMEEHSNGPADDRTVAVKTTKIDLVKPSEQPLRIEETNSVSQTMPNTSNLSQATPHLSARDEFEALYRNRPASHMEWKQSTLAPLESHVPPEKRRSVKDIIESINRSQRLLQAAANKDLPLLSTTSQMPPPAYDEVVKQTNINGHKDIDLDHSLKSLDETQREIERMFEDIIAEDASDETPSHSGNQYLAGYDLQKPNNEEVFKKCRVTKEVYDYRETSPTTSNLDWNPVPKPKRSKNLSEQREH